MTCVVAQVVIGCNTVSSAVCFIIVSVTGQADTHVDVSLDLCPMYSRCCYSERRREGEGEREGGEGREGGRGRERGREWEREGEGGGGRGGGREGGRGRERESCQ